MVTRMLKLRDVSRNNGTHNVKNSSQQQLRSDKISCKSSTLFFRFCLFFHRCHSSFASPLDTNKKWKLFLLVSMSCDVRRLINLSNVKLSFPGDWRRRALGGTKDECQVVWMCSMWLLTCELISIWVSSSLSRVMSGGVNDLSMACILFHFSLSTSELWVSVRVGATGDTADVTISFQMKISLGRLKKMKLIYHENEKLNFPSDTIASRSHDMSWRRKINSGKIN